MKHIVVRLLAIFVTLATCGAVATAQQSAKVPRIGYLAPVFPCSGSVPSLEAFRQGLRDLGYVEAKNITIECRSAEGKPHRLSALAADLVRLKVDLIVAAGGELVARAAKQASPTLPIVMTNVCDPIGTGLVVSLAQPGANITGLSIMSPELSGKRLELLKEAVPKIRRVAVFQNPDTPCNVVEFRETDKAARGMGLQAQSLEVRSPSDFAKAFSAITKEHAHALLTLPDPITNIQAKQIADFAAKSRLPAIYHRMESVKAQAALWLTGPAITICFAVPPLMWTRF